MPKKTMTIDQKKRLPQLHRENARLRQRIMKDAVVSDAAAESVAKIAQSLVNAKSEAERLRAALSALLQSNVGRQTLAQLGDGQGTATDEGQAWLAAAALVLGPNAKLSRQGGADEA